MDRFFRYLRYYVKYHKDINELYSYSLKGKNGEQVAEGLTWFERTDYWLKTE